MSDGNSRSEFEQWDIVSSVGFTALMVAAGRAVETSEPGGLVDDPYAELFVDRSRISPRLPTRHGQPWPSADGGVAGPEADVLWSWLSRYQGVRSRYFDAVLTGAAGRGVDQVVILAAGLDVRAYRLDWPAGTTVYEIDQEQVLEFKDTVLAEEHASAHCTRRPVAVDLRDDWVGALRAAGFDPARPTAWLAEGLLPFLPASAQAELFGAVDKLSAPGSVFAVEHFAGAFATMRGGPAAIAFGAPFGVDMNTLTHADDPEDPAARLASSGWQVTARTSTELAHEYGRPFAEGVDFESVLLEAHRPD
jgi:methyltransferase (TIGR00027 family)